MKILAFSFVATACLLAAHFVTAKLPPFKEASFPCDELPFNVKPIHYDLGVRFPSVDSGLYEGQVDINVRYKEVDPEEVAAFGLQDCLSAPIYDDNTIVLHADKSLKIQDIKVTSQSQSRFTSGNKLKQRKIKELLRDDHMIAIKVKRGIRPSEDSREGKISIKFQGQISEDERKVYSGTNNAAKEIARYIGSKFVKREAKSLFPVLEKVGRFMAPLAVRVTYPNEITAENWFHITDVD